MAHAARPRPLPGANLYLAVLLAFVGILPLNLLYVRLAVAFPRSGGDYVSISRTLSPALGFAVNAAAMAYFCLFVGLGGLYTVQYGLTPLAQRRGRLHGQRLGDPPRQLAEHPDRHLPRLAGRAGRLRGSS